MIANRPARLVVLLAVLVAPALLAQSPGYEPPRYLLPPKAIVDAFDVAPLPQTMLSPNKQVLALTYRRPQPTIAELAQPMLRIAGTRVNPKTYGPHRTALITGITLKKISDGSEVKLTVPPQANLSNVEFSPDGAHLAFLNTKENGIDLWVADTATGSAKAVTGSDHINATAGDPCDWLSDNTTLACAFVPAGRGPAPPAPTVPSGPNVQENYGKPAPAPTYED